MLSGVGDAHELSRHGIEPALDLPNVGHHLKEQPLVTALYRCRVPTNNLTEGLLQKVGIAAQFLLHGEGPISNIFEGAAFVRSSPAQPTPDLQLVFMTCGWMHQPDGSLKRAPYPAVGVHILASYPKSSGRIHLKSRDPNDAPLIECPLLEQQADMDALVKGIGIVRRIMKAEPMNSLIADEIAPTKDVQSVPALEAFVREQAGISFHPVGTCRMGTSSDAVVGPELRVRGTDNLWVADASVIPDQISANMNAVCIMIGMKLGKHLASQQRRA
jgi:choline dehydrogenase-like flavoprotein